MNYFFGNETFYGPRKPPIVVVNPVAAFTCTICGRRGKGPPNSIVHPGRCREEHNRRLARKTAEKRREKKRQVAIRAAEQRFEKFDAAVRNTFRSHLESERSGDAGQKVDQ